MNRHGSSFGSNNCSKRVAFSVSIHFLSCGFGRVLRSASTGDAPFLGVPKSPVFSPASPVLGPANPLISPLFSFSFTSFSRFSSCLFMNYAHFPDFLSNFLFAPNTKWQFFRVCGAYLRLLRVQHNSYHFPVSH